GLADRGVTAGDVVCLLMPSSPEYMVCYQAVMRLGAITSGINQRLGPEEVAHILDRARPRVTVVGDGGAWASTPAAGTVRPWDEISGVITTVIAPVRWEAGETLRLIERERVTVGQGVPTQWELMLRHPAIESTDVSSLRLAATGGGTVSADLLGRMRAAFGV